MLWGNFKPERPGQPDIPARSPHECCNGTENTRLKDEQDPVMTRRIPSYDTHHDSDVDAVQVHWPRYRTISQVPPVTERCDALTVSQGFFATCLPFL
jgi:hypothetical protein